MKAWLAQLVSIVFVASVATTGAKASGEENNALLRSAEAALKSGKPTEAITLIGRVLTADPKNFRALSNAAVAYQRRGVAHFRLGQFKESIADFDRFLELMPAEAPQHWQRGIALYYAGRYEDGRKQFELHQTVNSHDVENAVWHFLCVARASGVEKARAALIPIEGDARVPMAQVHALFANKAKPEDVLAAAKAGDPSPNRLDHQLFFAHLYLGLYFEAIGNAEQTREHILKAATGFKADHYMGDVARVHAQVLRKKPGG